MGYLQLPSVHSAESIMKKISSLLDGARELHFNLNLTTRRSFL
jgi:hypothetical protein